MSDKNKGGFREVRKDAPCVVCQKDSWCCISADNLTALCMRREGGKVKQFKNGNVGYIYRLDGLEIKAAPVALKSKEPTPKIKDVLGLARQMFLHPEAERKRREVAAELGVSLRACEDILSGVGWDAHNGHEFASFPSFARGRCVGITRRYKGGKKKTVKGTSNGGVFVCREYWIQPGPVFIVEGASDVLAFRSCNLCVIGRPSNIGGASVIADMIQQRRLQRRSVVVVVELDQKDHDSLSDHIREHHDPDCLMCSACWPGAFGAEKSCEQLRAAGINARWAVPALGCKDGREMVNKGKVEEWLESEHIRDCVFVPALDIGG